MSGNDSAPASFVTHLECSTTGTRYSHDCLRGLSDDGAPLLVRYDLDAIAGVVTPGQIKDRDRDMWRVSELLPIPIGVSPVTLGEAVTPLIRLRDTKNGGGNVMIKDEGRLPTGSFKARGMAVAVTMARHFGKRRLAVPTAGNAGAAAAAYGARAEMEVFVFTPDDTPEVTVREIGYHGAKVYRVNGIIGDCAKIVRQGTSHMQWHDLSTLEEPYRLEGKKTMGLELAEQLGWELPQVIYYPTGGGTGFIGMWKAFDEMEALGWIGSERPRMVCVQSTGCSPILAALEAGEDEVANAWSPVETDIPGVRVPKPLGGALILEVIRKSHGFAAVAEDVAAHRLRDELAVREGIHLSVEGALCLAAYRADREAGRVTGDERVVIFNTATGFKAPMPPVERRLDCTKAIDYATLANMGSDACRE
jgi:threonine synthase